MRIYSSHLHLYRKGSKRCKLLFILFLLTAYLIWRFLENRKDNEHNIRTSESPFNHHLAADSILNGLVNKDDLFESRGQSCVHPDLDPYHSDVSKFFHSVPPIQCNKESNWIETGNGTFWISEDAKLKHGDITCLHIPILRGPDDYKIKNGKAVKFKNGVQVAKTDFFRVSCWSQNGAKYFNVHATIAHDKYKMNRVMKTNHSSVSMPFNVLMIGFDSVSSMSWLRKLPKTKQYFDDVLWGITLKGYNIVGDGTPQNLLPILTGKTEHELPESRRGNPSASTVDGHPWIWKAFHENGYITQWGEDMAFIGTFNLRMMGFKNQPVDHYMRPFYLAAERMYPFNSPRCLGSTPRHKIMFNWIRDSFIMYPHTLKFIFAFHSEYSHKNLNDLELNDNDLKELLYFLYEGSFLDNTILILMSDHGSRFHYIRQTIQGKYEERMPYFAFRFPTSFKRDYPKAFENFKINANRLTTPFDIYETFQDILNYNTSKRNLTRNRRAVSLFQDIPKERTCSQADIDPHWCACLGWKVQSTSSLLVKTAVRVVVKLINNITKKFRHQCHFLLLKNIKHAFTIKGNEDIEQFEGSIDTDGRIPNITEKEASGNILLQVTFMTIPGDSIFEATVVYVPIVDQVLVNRNQISRLNAYGSAAACIVHDAPHLRPYCFCTE